MWWVSLLHAASADRIIPCTCFQGRLTSFSPSVTGWSDPVYMQTYSLTPPFKTIQSILLTPYCEPTHHSDGPSPSLPSPSRSSLNQLPFFWHPSFSDRWLMLLDKGEGKYPNFTSFWVSFHGQTLLDQVRWKRWDPALEYLNTTCHLANLACQKVVGFLIIFLTIVRWILA